MVAILASRGDLALKCQNRCTYNPPSFFPKFSNVTLRGATGRRVSTRHWFGLQKITTENTAGSTVVARADLADNGATDAAGGGFLGTAGQQAAAYSLLLMVYASLGLGLTLNPSWAFTIGFGMPSTELFTGLMGVYASYFWVAVGAVACLKEAAEHRRMASDTYKRLNLAMLTWAVMSNILNVCFMQVSNQALTSGYASVGLLTAAVCGRIYSLSGDGFNLLKMLGGLLSGVVEALQPKNAAAAVHSLLIAAYLVCWVLLTFTNLHPLFLGDIGLVGQYLKRKMGLSMLLVGIVHFVLKDAADRKRLGASTFRQLNLAVSIYSIVGGWYFYRMWTAGVPVLEPLMIAVLGMSAFTVFVCDGQYFFAKK